MGKSLPFTLPTLFGVHPQVEAAVPYAGRIERVTDGVSWVFSTVVLVHD